MTFLVRYCQVTIGRLNTVYLRISCLSRIMDLPDSIWRIIIYQSSSAILALSLSNGRLLLLWYPSLDQKSSSLVSMEVQVLVLVHMLFLVFFPITFSGTLRYRGWYPSVIIPHGLILDHRRVRPPGPSVDIETLPNQPEILKFTRGGDHPRPIRQLHWRCSTLLRQPVL